MESKNVIYQIRNIINGKKYIGSAIDFSKRQRQHRSLLKSGKHHSIVLQRAWNKYGETAFVFEILETVCDNSKLIEREQNFLDYLKTYQSKNGYNICKIAGNTLGFKHTDKTKKLMSQKHTGIKTRPCSEDTKEKMSNTKKQSDLAKAMLKRKKTLLNKGKDIFKKIGEKSSKTQQINGLNKGINNPNSNNNDILIFNNVDEVVYITNNTDFENFCVEHKLPARALIKSRMSDGNYKLYQYQKPRNEEFSKYKGWYCRYN